MAGWAPLFDSLTTGTLCGRWPDIGLWPIVLSMKDRHGIVDVTHAYIAGVTGLALDDVIKCMSRFCEPDPASRSQEANGARLVRLHDHRDWGWQVVNHEKYREKARKSEYDAARTASGADAERKKASRAVPRSPAESRAGPLSDADADADTSETPLPPKGGRRTGLVNATEFEQGVIDTYHRLLPNHPKVVIWSKDRRKLLQMRVAEGLSRKKNADQVEYWGRYFTIVARSKFLTGENKDGWIATFEWLIRPTNFRKVVEGNYDR